MTCFVMGDSIAVGVGVFMPDCQTRAKSGITSTAYLRTLARPVTADLVVVSLGANDWHLATRENLEALRQGVTARRVVWLLPNIQRPGVRDAIQHVAASHRDAVVDTTPYAGHDRVHPTAAGYRSIAGQARGNDGVFTQLRLAPRQQFQVASPAAGSFDTKALSSH